MAGATTQEATPHGDEPTDAAADSSCPICGGALRASDVVGEDRLITGEGSFTVMECAECHYGVTFPQLSGAELAHYYSPEYYDFLGYSGERGGNPLQRALTRFREWSANRSYRRQPYVLEGVAPGRVLDVGCGNGDLLSHFAQRGWEVYGLDPGESAVKAATARGVHAHRGTLDDQPWEPHSFGLVTFQHTLEHVPSPLQALASAARLLEPGGLLVIDVPNWWCWQRRLLFRSRWSQLDLPRHLQHFSTRALARIAASLGLQVKALGTTSSVPVIAYSLHYALFGRMRGGWRKWFTYGLGLLLFPLVYAADRVGGGDSCYIVMQAPAGDRQGRQSSGASAGK